MGEIINFYEIDEVKKTELTDYDISIINTIIQPEQISQCIHNMQQYSPNEGWKVIMLDIRKIHDSWKNDGYYYILPPNENKKTLKKYCNSKRDLIDGKIHEPPIIGLNCDGNISFVNGRHRFSNLRDAGATIMPFLVDEQDVEYFMANFYNKT